MVRFLAIGVASICIATSLAFAGPSAAELQTTGELLAKAGRFTEAIDAFKAADKLQPTAGHACLIALAYTRRELWPQAEIFIATCLARATSDDAPPDWVPLARQQLDERFATANVAAVEIEVTPADAIAQITASSFAPDETFPPRTIHLPPGHHTFRATAPGYEAGRGDIDIVDKTPQHVVIQLHKIGEPRVTPPVAPMPTTVARDPLPRELMIAGAIVVGVGVITYGWQAYEWDKADHAADATAYDRYVGRYDLARISTIGLWTVGAGLAVTGYVLRSRHHEQAPAVSAAPLRGGGMLSVEWAR